MNIDELNKSGKLAYLNKQRGLINAITATGKTQNQTPINVAQFIATVVIRPNLVCDDENAEEYDQEIIKRGRLIQDWLIAMYDEDPDTFEVPAEELNDYLMSYFSYVEYLMMQHLKD